MGNCQAADMAAAAVVECPGGRVERVMDLQTGSVSAQRLMSAYPGYFVAVISASIIQPSSSARHNTATFSSHSQLFATTISNPVTSFKLLAADAPLRSGHRYRLLSFEEVLTCFSQQRCGAFVNVGRRPAMSMNAHKQQGSKHRDGRGHNLSNSHVVKIGC
ncbi:hypothetical protein L7F22_000138 [Adiantum nelumboides]|nr:hypothetical protein [Adiantum nelumboides]